ncbi:MAG: head-tail connector protein [Faecousia sp.]
MTSDELKLLKQYMHVDHDDDDALIQVLWSAASRYLKRGGAVSDDPDDSWLAAAGLVLQWYDGTPLPDGVQRLINQLKLDNPVF